MAKRDYHALAMTSGVLGVDPVLHLVRDDSESALCGIPRSALEPADGAHDLVCSTCLDWLPRRVAFSAAFPRLQRT
jgi:hypothetical protein